MGKAGQAEGEESGPSPGQVLRTLARPWVELQKGRGFDPGESGKGMEVVVSWVGCDEEPQTWYPRQRKFTLLHPGGQTLGIRGAGP